VAIPADDGEVVPAVIGRIAVDVVLFDGMSRLVADAARVPVRRHEPVCQIGRNTLACFHVTSIACCDFARQSRRARAIARSYRRPPVLSLGVISVELLIIKVVAAVAVTGLAVRVFIWEAAAIAAGFRQLRRQISSGRRGANSGRAGRRSNV
jgi:hypothetical protein